MLASFSHPSNILRISMTADVSKLLKSILFRLVHPKNIAYILVTFAVLNLLKSSSVKFEES